MSSIPATVPTLVPATQGPTAAGPPTTLVPASPVPSRIPDSPITSVLAAPTVVVTSLITTTITQISTNLLRPSQLPTSITTKMPTETNAPVEYSDPDILGINSGIFRILMVIFIIIFVIGLMYCFIQAISFRDLNAKEKKDRMALLESHSLREKSTGTELNNLPRNPPVIVEVPENQPSSSFASARESNSMDKFALVDSKRRRNNSLPRSNTLKRVRSVIKPSLLRLSLLNADARDEEVYQTFVFTDDLYCDVVINFLRQTFLSTTIAYKAAHDFTPIEAGQIHINKDNVLKVYDHLYNGFCYGINIQTDQIGLFPVTCLNNHNQKLNIIKYDYDDELELLKNEMELKTFQYCLEYFTDVITITKLELDNIQFDKIFKDLKENQEHNQCFISGTDAFVDNLQNRLANIGVDKFNSLD
ncbi:hypothetical protein BC833DRAFT_600449 [Globomyces pollinis-pini]|nr:hypothetical protein BC833DRAFT_600449 [Globomyces pollinis-pini]